MSAGGAVVSTGASGESKITPGQDGNLHVENKKMTLARFADFLGRYSERPVFDSTGLQGAYEMEFDVSGEEVRNAARAHGVAIPPPAAAKPPPIPPAYPWLPPFGSSDSNWNPARRPLRYS